jgi:hypothetical protein
VSGLGSTGGAGRFKKNHAHVTTGLVVIISIDHPFAGSVHIYPDALEAVLTELGNSPR